MNYYLGFTVNVQKLFVVSWFKQYFLIKYPNKKKTLENNKMLYILLFTTFNLLKITIIVSINSTALWSFLKLKKTLKQRR